MKKIIFTALVVLSCEAMHAQYSYDYLKAADSYYKKGDYYSAAQYYEKWLEANKSKISQAAYNPYTAQANGQATSKKKSGALSSEEQVIYHLAESYRLLHFPAKAEGYYQQAMSFDKTQYPLAGYFYGLTLKALQKYSEAERAFTAFLDGYTGADEFSQAAKREVESLKYIATQLNKKDINLYAINKATELNAKGANYAPVWLGNSLLFTSTRMDSNKGKDQSYINRVYEAVYNENALTNIQKTSLPQAGDMHQGVISVTPNGNTMFLTRWTINHGKKMAALYSSTKTSKGWSEPALVGGDVNVAGYSTQQPFVTIDGKQIYYSSDKPGGQGGFDLWVADLSEDGQVSNSRNLGSINSTGDDQAPFYHAASQTLVFSTNGRVGMGGYDFFYSKGTVGNWAAPKNFGYPVNSVKDDIYFTSRGSAKNILENALLSSDRASECCLELFALNKQRPLKQVSGVVLNCENQQPLAGINVQVIDPSNNAVVTTQTTGADGRYTFTLKDFKVLKAVAASEGFISNALAIAAPADEEAESLTTSALCLNPVPKAIVLENVYYDYNKASLKPASYPSLDQLVTMLQQNPSMVIEIGAHTDSKGTDAYNLKLSEARAQSVVAYLVKNGIEKTRLQAKGYGATQPIAPNTNEDGADNPEGRQKNRRTEFKVLSK